jgi:hypothetical protein
MFPVSSQSRFWLYAHPVDMRKSFDGLFPTETLKNFEGYLQTDGYAGYNEIGKRKEISQLACFARVRRKFFESQGGDKKRASWMLKRIRYLYLIERKGCRKGVSFEERYELRQKYAKPHLALMHKWLLDNQFKTLPKSKIGKAISYTLGLWKRLIHYIEDGQLEIDNNLVENSIRPVALGRKNYLFAGSHNGAEWAAVIYTLLENAKLKGLEAESC